MTDFLLRLFVKNCEEVKNQKVRESYGKLSGTVGIVCNIILSTVKIASGILTSSISVTADGLNNLSDTGSSVITVIGFKMSNIPPDSHHPYGHGRIEYLSAFIVSVFIMLMGGELAISSLKSLISGEEEPEYTFWTLTVLGISAIIKFWMFMFNRKLGKAINSEVLTAAACDCAADGMSSAAILVSAAVSMLVKLPFNLDAVMALAVSALIIRSGLLSAKDTVNDLLGNPPPEELVNEIKEIILSFKDFLGLHDLIIHNYGPGRQFASVHVEIPQDIDIVRCHEKIDMCEKLVNERTGVLLVIHMDPVDINNKNYTTTKKLIEDKIKEIDDRLTMHDFRIVSVSADRINLIFDVVVPEKFDTDNNELEKKISAIAKNINPSYACVITFDSSFL